MENDKETPKDGSGEFVVDANVPTARPAFKPSDIFPEAKEPDEKPPSKENKPASSDPIYEEIPRDMWEELYELKSDFLATIDPLLKTPPARIQTLTGLTYQTFKTEPKLRKIRPRYVLITALLTDALAIGRGMIQVSKRRQGKPPADDTEGAI